MDEEYRMRERWVYVYEFHKSKLLSWQLKTMGFSGGKTFNPLTLESLNIGSAYDYRVTTPNLRFNKNKLYI